MATFCPERDLFAYGTLSGMGTLSGSKRKNRETRSDYPPLGPPLNAREEINNSQRCRVEILGRIW